MALSDARAVASAVNRFGLGARPGELQAVADAPSWLLAQIARPPDGGSALARLPSSLDYLRLEAGLKTVSLEARRTSPGPSPTTGPDEIPADPVAQRYRHDIDQHLREEKLARWRIAVGTDTPFAERLVRFWSNHFAVSVDKGTTRLYAGALEREAIRPHLNDRFIDMLLAVETHPAMLRYLDQPQSIGPDSRRARAALRNDQRGRPVGLNENLAREILELHTLGAEAGYRQDDVTELARALTGWSMPFPRQVLQRSTNAAFVYREAAHDPGMREVLGRRYPDNGFEQARAILTDLAMHPATAHQLALQLARHFVDDQPPPAMVRRMAAAYLADGGSLRALYAGLVHSPEAWDARARKFRTPQDFIIAALRAGAIDIADHPQPLEGMLMRLGQPTFMPRSPAGFSDLASDWISADALWKRVQVAEALAERVPRSELDPAALARAALGTRVRADTLAALARAEAPQQAVAIFFASPEFQWRV